MNCDLDDELNECRPEEPYYDVDKLTIKTTTTTTTIVNSSTKSEQMTSSTSTSTTTTTKQTTAEEIRILDSAQSVRLVPPNKNVLAISQSNRFRYYF
jgi:hypothetical protein